MLAKEVYPHGHPKRSVLLLTPFYREKTGASGRVSQLSKVRGEEELGFEARSAELSAPFTRAELGAGRLDIVFCNILPQALTAYSLRQEVHPHTDEQ